MLPKMKIQKTVIVFSIILLALVSCKSSYTKIGDKNANYIPYYLKVYETDSLFIVGDYQRSYEILDSLFKKYEPIEMEGYYEYSNYVFSAVLSDNTQNIKKIAKKGYINNGDLSAIQVSVLKKLDSINTVIGLDKKEIEKYKQIYSKNINWKLREQIHKMSDEDQAIRQVDKIDMTQLADLTRVHEKMIKEIFEKHGYPNTKKIGFEENLRAVFLHTDPVEYKPNYLLPKLKEYTIKGYENPAVYAVVYDKWYYFNNRKYYYSPPKDHEVFTGAKLDSVRKTIGLPHLKYNDWRSDKFMKEIIEYRKENRT